MNVCTYSRLKVFDTQGINNRFKTLFDASCHLLANQNKLPTYTVSTLPTGTVGDIAYVTDANSPTYGATLVGGGSTITIAFFNGTNWTAH